MPLVTTAKAAADTGLSEWELRRGYKAGEYPAIPIGRGGRSRRLRWDLEILKDAIKRKMKEGKNDD